MTDLELKFKDAMDKDLISLLYVGDKINETHWMEFSKANGFSAVFQENIPGEKGAENLVEINLPDIIVFDLPLIRALDPSPVRAAREWIHGFKNSLYRPGVFLAVDTFPEFEMRMAFHDCGYDDFIVLPASARELAYRARIYMEKKNLEQQGISQKQTLERAFSYLDKFKQELKTAKKELGQEKNSLNNALKQIHHMTHERGLMKKSMKEMKESLDRDREGFGHLLSTLIQTRVEANRGHGDRVANIAGFLAKQFDFDEKKLDDLGKAGMLHEIGLLFMSGQALQKDKRDLTHYEKEIWIQYPVKGADLLKECPGFEGCANIIRSLNENSDGTGFPLGLKRKHIPLASRILAGADELDLLKEKVRSLEDLLAGLETLAGTRLDPVIVAGLEKYAVLHMGSDAYPVRGVGVENLEPGMRLGTALFTSGGTKLFSMDTLLTQESIDKIIQYNREYPVDEIIYIKA